MPFSGFRCSHDEESLARYIESLLPFISLTESMLAVTTLTICLMSCQHHAPIFSLDNWPFVENGECK